MDHIAKTISDNRAKLIEKINSQREYVRASPDYRDDIVNYVVDRYFDELIEKLKGGVIDDNKTTG